MNWNKEIQARFDQLRAAELAGTLTRQETAELAELVAALESDQARYLASTLTRMRAEQKTLRKQLGMLQSENEELAKLLSQQEQLAAEARRWLAQFRERHRIILQTYTRLTGETLVAPVSS